MKSAHDTEMRDVYAHIYQDRYGFEPQAMAAVAARIEKNLKEFGIAKTDLTRMNILNVGPSREALALHQMGAQNIFHFDISDLAVGALRRLQADAPEFANIVSVQRDLCDAEDLPIDGGVDFVYLSGVLHHLHDPSRAMANIFPHLNPGARLYFRIYRSGCMAFFCGDFVRHFIGYDDREVVDAVFRRRYPDFTAKDKVLYDDLWDNFFVPIQNLFDPRAVDAFFSARGFKVAVSARRVPYDHQDSRDAGQGVSLYYTRDAESLGAVAPGSFPSHVDQLSDIDYREDYIRGTVALMQNFIARCPTLPAETRAEVAIEVYRLGQLRRFPGPISAEGQHRKIHAVLESYA